jgi:hypothetical protein
VQLPPTPPPGYGGPTVDQIWQDVFPGQDRQAYQLLTDAGWFALDVGNAYTAFKSVNSQYISLLAQWNFPQEDLAGFEGPVPDAGDILADDTRLTWITRTTNPIPDTWLWTTGAPFGGDQVWCFNKNDLSSPTSYWRLDMTEQQFNAMKVAALAQAMPPVWPGLAGVTLLTPVDLAPPHQTLDVACDGALVNLTAWSIEKPVYDFDSQVAHGFAGGITFVSDNGYAEPEQRLGFETALYTPREMAHAAKVVLRLQLAISGTIQPWTLNS